MKIISYLKEHPCLCLRLEYGASVIAIIEIIVSLCMACLVTVALAQVAVVHGNQDSDEMQRLTYRITELHPELGKNKTEQEPEYVFTMLYFLFGFTLLRSFTEIFCATMLIFGIRQSNIFFLKIWLFFKASCITLSVALVILDLLLDFDNHHDVAEIQIPAIISVFLGAYFFFVVHRLYEEIHQRLRNTSRVKPRQSLPQEPQV